MPARHDQGDGNSLEPLLSVSVDVPEVGGDGDAGGETANGEVGKGTTVQEALYRNPREAIKWLEGKGDLISPLHACMSLAISVRRYTIPNESQTSELIVQNPLLAWKCIKSCAFFTPPSTRRRQEVGHLQSPGEAPITAS